MAEYEPPRDTRVIETREVETRRSGFPGWLIAVVIVAVLVVAAFAFGLVDIDQTADVALPDVKVETTGGQAPEFEVNTADIDVGTEKKTIEVPTIDVEKADE